MPAWQRIAPNTGFNCEHQCTVRKVGAIRIADVMAPTMFVNYIAQSSRTTNSANAACVFGVHGIGRPWSFAPAAIARGISRSVEAISLGLRSVEGVG